MMATRRLVCTPKLVRPFSSEIRPPHIIKKNVWNNFGQAVGNTSLIKLKAASKLTGCEIYGKAEFENPGGSIKDRAALWMIMDAEKRGILTPGKPGLIVEGTAGNTGIGLTQAGNSRGYNTVILMPSSQSQEKKDTLRQMGAHLIEIPPVPYKNPNNYVHVAARLAKSLGPGVMYADQWDNLANRRAHIEGTGPEMWEQLDHKLDAFSCAMGTGGTLAGTAEFLRSVNPDVKIGLTDPCGAALYRYYTEGELRGEGDSIAEGIGQGRVTGNMGGFRPDLAFEVPDAEALRVLYDLMENEGLALGLSSGINVAGAIRVAKELGPGHTVVTILCDLANRYSSKLYNPSFLASRNLPVLKWLQETDATKEFAAQVDEKVKGAMQ